MTKRLAAIVVVLVAMMSISGSVRADWSGEAEVRNSSISINSMEHLTVVVRNVGPDPIEVRSVAVTINWHGMPTLYQVFEGHAVIPAGESREFVSPPIRMPNVELGTYECFAGVVARGPDGVAVEHRYPSTIDAGQISLAPLGVPEELFFPLVLTIASVLVTLVLFKLERREQYPYVTANFRWLDHQ